MNKNLWKMAFAGIIALAALAPASARERTGTKFRPAAHGFVLTEGRIHRMKAALRLTQVQEKYWPPIEAALREMARELSHRPASGESGAAIGQDRVQRLASAAYPLLATLDETQKRDAMALVRAMGLGSLVASF